MYTRGKTTWNRLTQHVVRHAVNHALLSLQITHLVLFVNLLSIKASEKTKIGHSEKIFLFFLLLATCLNYLITHDQFNTRVAKLRRDWNGFEWNYILAKSIFFFGVIRITHWQRGDRIGQQARIVSHTPQRFIHCLVALWVCWTVVLASFVSLVHWSRLQLTTLSARNVRLWMSSRAQ